MMLSPVETIKPEGHKPLPPIRWEARFSHMKFGAAHAWINLQVAQTCGLKTDVHALHRTLDRIITRLDHADTSRMKHDARSTVYRIDNQPEPGLAWIAKLIRLKPWKLRLYHAIRRTPAWREWYGAMKLIRVQVRCNPPLALVQSDSFGPGAQLLILPYVPGITLADWLVQYDQSSGCAQHRRRLAYAMGMQIGQLLHRGIVNRDHKPTNLILDEASLRDAMQPIVIDPAGLRPRLNDQQVLRMLANLNEHAEAVSHISPRDRLAFLRGMVACNPQLGPIARKARHAMRNLTSS